MKAIIQDSRVPEGCRVVNLNRRKAIAERCLNCGGFDYSARLHCEITNCQLYPYRTGSGKQDSKARNAAIRAYCKDSCMCGNARYVWQCKTPDCALYAYRMSSVDKSVEV